MSDEHVPDLTTDEGSSLVLSGEEEQEALFAVDPGWKDLWQGMPDYSHEDLEPWQSIYVHFKTMRDREDFAKLVRQPLHSKTKFIWHPKQMHNVLCDKVYTTEKINPRYPVYIISKGRWESRWTSKALDFLGVPYHIVIEPQEREQYAAVIDPVKILVLPFSNLGEGSIPARNWVWEHAVASGAARHWILDDNVKWFGRFHQNKKIEVDSGVTFRIVEDWVDRYEDVVMAGFNYDYFVPHRQGASIKPVILNTRIYSTLLLSNAIPHRWRGRYNEDTDLSLRLLKDGFCTALFNAFPVYKGRTLTMKGGNTDELYAGVEVVVKDWEAHANSCKSCKECLDGYGSKAPPCAAGVDILSKDGRWLMAESLRMQHPDVTTVERKWRRWQHRVDYRQFDPSLGRNVLHLKPGVVITDGSIEYGMALGAMPVGVNGRNVNSLERTPGPSALAFVQGLASHRLVPEAGQPNLHLRPPDLKRNLEVRGHRLLTCEGRLFVSEASKLTDDDRVQIKRHREALIALAEEWKVMLAAVVHEPQPERQKMDVNVLTAREGSIPSPALIIDPDGVNCQSIHATEMTSVPTSLFDEHRPVQTLAQFLGEAPLAHLDANFVPDEPPDLTGINEVVLNFATNGLDWVAGARPIGVTVSTLDGKLCHFLPFAFTGGNLDEQAVKRWAIEQLRGKKIIGSKVKFDVHMAREWGIDLEGQGCTFSDIQHTAALLDDHRKRFALDVLAADYFPGEHFAPRVNESRHHEHHASEVAERERVTVQLVRRLRSVMYPELDKQELRAVQDLEDAVIPAVVEMEKNGSPLDLELLEQYHAEVNRKHGELLWEVVKECGFAFDHTAKSWQRLFESLGLPSTDGNDEAVIDGIDHPTVKKAYLAAQYASLNSKTFKAYKENVGSDGILRFEINQLRGDDGGTVSGRFSIGYVQQVPNYDNHSAVFGEELFPRRIFVAANGDYLESDAMQIEQRLLVHYAGNEEIIKEYEGDLERLQRGEDPVSFHKVTWAMMKRYKPNMLYSHQKSFNFAKQYGARSIKLAIMMGFITQSEGDEIRGAKRWGDPRLKAIKEVEAAYKRMMPEGDALLDRASHLAKPKCDEFCKLGDALHRQYPHRGYVKTLLGRRSRFPSGYKAYVGLNRVLQGTGADIMKAKLVELHRERKCTGFVMRLTIHDAVGGDATAPETRGMVSEILNRQSFQLNVPILWECKAGRNWAECK